MVKQVPAYKSSTDGRLFSTQRQAEVNDIRNRLMSLFDQDAEMVDKIMRRWSDVVCIVNCNYEANEPERGDA